MSHKEYVYKQVEGGQPLEASVWYKQGGSDAPKPIGKCSIARYGLLYNTNSKKHTIFMEEIGYLAIKICFHPTT